MLVKIKKPKMLRMRKFIGLFCLLSIWACEQNKDAGKAEGQQDFQVIQVEYPDTYEDATIEDNYFGTIVKDPYRWLEDDNSASTLRWVDQQQQLVANYRKYLPGKEGIKKRLAELWNYERFSVPEKKGDYYYMFKNDGLQDQDILYRMANLDGPMEAVLNPNNFSSDGTVALGEKAFSKDGTLLAYQVAEGGSDWKSIHIKDVESGSMLQDTVRWVKFSEIAWHRDGFFYARYPVPPAGEELVGTNEFHQVYYHKVGTTQEEDELIFADRQFPQRTVSPLTTSDEQYLVLSVAESTSGNAVYFQDLNSKNLYFTPIVENFDHDFELIGSTEDALLLLTNYQADNQRIIKVDTRNPVESSWEEIVAPSEDLLLGATKVGDHLVAHYLRNAHSVIRIFDLEGKLEKLVNLPGYGSILNWSEDEENQRLFFSYTTFTQAESVYQLSLSDFSVSEFRRSSNSFKTGEYEVKQVEYKSYDGTAIPMYIIHKKNIKLDGNHPTLLYGYGGFNIPITPKFNRTRNMLFPVVLEHGGVCAVPNLRGGGEFGSDWHSAGTLHRKQNVFDDFQSAAEYLIANKYTNADKLAIHGASNGGLLVGACMIQRPDLYKVAFPAVGVLDMLRYHRFTIGWAWATDYGTSEDKTAFDYLYAYSPLHNVIKEQYPATMITTADHDDRVVPAHSFKFGAALQAKQQGTNPILIRIESSAGHGAGKPTSKRIEEGADMLSFMFYNMKEPIKY
jgi:prolyl oligopeptidase